MHADWVVQMHCVQTKHANNSDDRPHMILKCDFCTCRDKCAWKDGGNPI